MNFRVGLIKDPVLWTKSFIIFILFLVLQSVTFGAEDQPPSKPELVPLQSIKIVQPNDSVPQVGKVRTVPLGGLFGAVGGKVGAGVLISPNLVLTAKHTLVYNWRPGWKSWVLPTIFALDSGNRTRVTGIYKINDGTYVPVSEIRNDATLSKIEEDQIIIRLAAPMGFKTGYIPVASAEELKEIVNNDNTTLKVIGYNFDHDFLYQLFNISFFARKLTNSGAIDGHTDTSPGSSKTGSIYIVNSEGFGGMSGGPLIANLHDGSQRVIGTISAKAVHNGMTTGLWVTPIANPARLGEIVHEENKKLEKNYFESGQCKNILSWFI